MVRQRFRIACPRCSHTLHIPIESAGKKGVCKYCGHRFRAGPKIEPGPQPGRTGPPVTGTEKPAGDLWQWLEMMDREFQETLAILTAKRAGLFEQMIAELGDQVVHSRSQILAHEQLLRSLIPGHDRDVTEDPTPPEFAAEPDETGSLDPLLQSTEAFVTPSIPEPAAPEAMGRRSGFSSTCNDSSPVSDEMPVDDSTPGAPWADFAEGLDRLTRGHDETRAECRRLREEVRILRSGTTAHLAEISQLRKAAEKVQGLQTECDRLGADRDRMGREANQLQARLVELQVTLVETEAELDDSRKRAQAERHEWQERCEKVRVEGERRLAEQRSEFEAERQAWREQVAIHRKVVHEAEALQVKVKKLRNLYDATRQERDEAYRQIEVLGQRCSHLSTYLDEAESERREADRGHQAEIDRLTSALAEALEEAESALRCDAAHVDQVRKLQAELAQYEHEPAMSLHLQEHGADLV